MKLYPNTNFKMLKYVVYNAPWKIRKAKRIGLEHIPEKLIEFLTN